MTVISNLRQMFHHLLTLDRLTPNILLAELSPFLMESLTTIIFTHK